MNLSVAVRVDQDAVLYSVCPTQRFIDDVVVVPACHLGDGLATDGADASLFLPKKQQPTLSLQGLFHLYAQAFFKVEFPCRVVGVTIPFDLGSFCRGVLPKRGKQVLDGCAIFFFCHAEEAPVLVTESSKIPILHPLLTLLWMSSSCPSPQCFEDGGVRMDKGFLGICMSVIVRPTPYLGSRVAISQYAVACLLSLMTFRMSVRNVFTFFFDGVMRSFPLYLRTCCPRKSNPSSMCVILVFSPKFQSSLLEISVRGLDSFFQYLFRASCNDEVICVTHHIDLLVHAFKRSSTGVMRVLLPKYPFQAVQRHIGKDGRDDSALRCPIFRRVEGGFVHVSCFQPCVEDGFIHRNMAQQPGVTDSVEAGFDVPFQYPLWSGAVRQHRITLCHSIGAASFLPKPIRVWVGVRFGNGVQGLQIQRLHCSVLHCRDTQRTFLPIELRNIHPSQWESFIASLLHLVYGHPLFFRVFPEDFIDSRSVLTLVFCHSSDSKSLAAERVGQQVLQGFHLMPLTGLHCLHKAPCGRLFTLHRWIRGHPVARLRYTSRV